ncbi:MMPL family transporter [Nonomuraea salmonea]|uniref:MMPL family transporter n=1 Tax=Nonomuraea salmonea TaxID=46181 RepID=UPI0031E5543F
MIRFCIRHRRLVMVLWLALVAALAGAAATWPGPSDDDFTLPGSESRQAAAFLGEAAEEAPGALVVYAPSGIESAPVRAALTGLAARVDAVPGAQAAMEERRVSQDGTIASIPLHYPDQAAAQAIRGVRDAFAPPAGTALTVELSGGDFADVTPGGVTEGLGLLAAAVVLLVAFRSLIAAALPLVIGIVGVTCGAATYGLLSHLVSTPGFGVYLTIMLGLGVGIDYALLIVTRFRTELAAADGAGGE